MLNFIVISNTLSSSISLWMFDREKDTCVLQLLWFSILLNNFSFNEILNCRKEKTISLDDHEAVEVISSKLNKMDQKLHDLNRYWTEMKKTKMPPSVLQYGESRKRQPARTKTFSGYDINKNKSQPSQKRQRRSTSDLGGQPIERERAARTRAKPKPPERSGSLHHNVKPPVREGLVTSSYSRPVNAGSQSLPRNFRPSSPDTLKQQLEEVTTSFRIGALFFSSPHYLEFWIVAWNQKIMRLSAALDEKKKLLISCLNKRNWENITVCA